MARWLRACRAVAVVGAGLLCAFYSPVGRGAEIAFTPVTQTNAWQVSWNNHPVLAYAFAPTQFKPYVKEFYTLKGVNILRDSPPDHFHHHGLMYAIRVNGINFWEETPGNGVQRVVQTWPPVAGKSPAGLPEAKLAQTIHWVAPKDAFLPETTQAALLIEQRVLTVVIDEARHEVALHWQSQFTVGTNQVELSGANYFGLGMRFRAEYDALAEHLNAGGKPDLSNGKQDVSQHAWGSVAFAAPARLASVVLYGHPKNARGEASYFTMEKPFAYLAATQGLEKEALTYAAGEKFALNYLVAVYPEIKTAEALSERGKQWLATP
jgi:hypothetical protein